MKFGGLDLEFGVEVGLRVGVYEVTVSEGSEFVVPRDSLGLGFRCNRGRRVSGLGFGVEV